MVIGDSVKPNWSSVLLMEKKLGGQYTFRIPVELEIELERIATKERRKRSDIARFLLERGLIAYDKDNQLFEPVEKEKAKKFPKTGAA